MCLTAHHAPIRRINLNDRIRKGNYGTAAPAADNRCHPARGAGSANGLTRSRKGWPKLARLCNSGPRPPPPSTAMRCTRALGTRPSHAAHAQAWGSRRWWRTQLLPGMRGAVLGSASGLRPDFLSGSGFGTTCTHSLRPCPCRGFRFRTIAERYLPLGLPPLRRVRPTRRPLSSVSAGNARRRPVLIGIVCAAGWMHKSTARGAI